MADICLATEDVVSEAVGEKLAGEAGLRVATPLRKNGGGYLRSKTRSLCEMARWQPVVLLTDLDLSECPPNLAANWFQHDARPDDFLFRVAVREIEAWLLADRTGIARFLQINPRHVPPEPDTLPDPKRQLVALATRAPRKIRDDIVPCVGAPSRQGVNYNSRLVDFVRAHWEPTRASIRSPSLYRARHRIAELAARL